jgi:hypothetical protein
VTDPQELLRTCLVAHYARTAVDGAAEDLAAVVVVRDLDPATVVRGALAFVTGLPPALGEHWRRSFTRTLFLAGNPASLADRVDFAVRIDDAMGWVAPTERHRTRDVSRALRIFHAPAEWPGLIDPFTVQVPATSAGADTPRPAPLTATLRVATAGVSAADYLVHINHTVCEAVLRGLLRPADRLRIVHETDLDLAGIDIADATGPAPSTHLRIAADHADPGVLRLYARLSTPERSIDERT